MTDFLVAAKSFHARSKELFAPPPVGFSPLEIEHLEESLGAAFPSAYREFLAWMGHDTGGAFQGLHASPRDFRLNADSLVELLTENGLGDRAPQTALVFWGDERRKFAWFEFPTAADDPALKVLELGAEIGPESIESRPALSAFLLEELSSEALEKLDEQRAAAQAPIGKLVNVADFATIVAAAAARVCLENEGIHAYPGAESNSTLFPGLAVASLQTLESDAPRALALLREHGMLAEA